MLNLTNLTLNESKDIFLKSNAIQVLPVVSAEWNQNLFNQPYLTVAGSGVNIATGGNIFISEGTVLNIDSPSTFKKLNFTTKSFSTSNGSGHVKYSITADNGKAYKIVTYVMTDKNTPLMLSSYAKGSNCFGSTSEDVNSYGWTKVVTYVGGTGINKNITSFDYTLSFNTYSSLDPDQTVYYTVPEVYQTTYFDYQYHSLWPTESPFQNFRPGESYISSGNNNIKLPDNFRKITNVEINGYTTNTFSPVSPIIQNPRFSVLSSPVPIFKNSMPSDMNPYKYFVSDIVEGYTPSISAVYDQNVSANKIVIKFNTLMTTPTIKVAIDGYDISVDGSTSIAFPQNASASNDNPNNVGTLILYWNGSAWTKKKWGDPTASPVTSMPHITSIGTITPYTSFKTITLTQTDTYVNSKFSTYPSRSTDVAGDLTRMQLVELSPRLEVDLTDFVKSVDINKSLDSKNNFVPISSINADDASIILSAIPITVNNGPIPVFSSQSNLSISILANMLRKNIKFYVNFKLLSYFSSSSNNYVNVNYPDGTYIPGGVYYSDLWDETDIKEIKVQCYDITRYLQTTPVPDYVANLKSPFDILTNILDLAGYTDYDYDSLYTICNDKALPIELAYYYCNSKDTTIIEALAQIFLAYQIGAYIDEFGVMRFLSLSSILSDKAPDITINESHIIEGGYAINNKAKPGKISLRYSSPKIKQSLSLQNATNADIKESPSFIYTTSNDVLWSQQSMDSVGFNYIAESMLEKDNQFTLDQNDLLDIFHTYSLNNNGYAAIENEIVSFVYKKYIISKLSDPYVNDANPGTSSKVYVKNDIELSSEINRFIKKYESGLRVSEVDENGYPTTKNDYDIKVDPTGVISSVQRGLFGTCPSDHLVMDPVVVGLTEKGLSEAGPSGFNSGVVDRRIAVSCSSQSNYFLYPTDEVDEGYNTYSVKFNITHPEGGVGGLFFNANANPVDTYFVEIHKFIPAGSTKYKYLLNVKYVYAVGDIRTLAYKDITTTVTAIMDNFTKILIKDGDTYSYNVTEEPFHLKVAKWTTGAAEGEIPGEAINVYLNNVEIVGLALPFDETNISLGFFNPVRNSVTGLTQKISLPNPVSVGSKFGALMQRGYQISGSSSITVGTISEIYACQKSLAERSVSYYFQDREFLNGLIQGENLFANSKSYMMQTSPEVIGINVYDIQYPNPAAVSADILPVQYLWKYFPGTQPKDQQFYQTQMVDKFSLAYSTVLNTGFRAKMAIANNASHMVYLKHDSDQMNQFTVNLNIWTHEIVAPSDPEIIEKIVDPSNLSEVAEVDSEWIQSKEAANKMLYVIERGLDGFSKDTTLSLYGNPLIQVGDIIDLSYNLAALNQQKYMVHSVSHTFDQGLTTKLVLNLVEEGITY